MNLLEYLVKIPTRHVKERQLSVCEITEPGRKFAFNQIVILLQLFILKKMENLLADDNLNSSLESVGLPCQDINSTREKNAS
ncbi:hypothetical protein TNCT_79881 [Trichonephila clavata]|uniref:Uncharacterized protein n=1 Tax=Trichonephila clavata TaxID=2740835 RepID=A0A8X6FWQ9_TRICU|nr:hypothetical protein TNCT_79881 [Trichonephila clavata]